MITRIWISGTHTILLRVLPPLAKDAATNERDPDYAVTVVGLLLYVVVVAGVLVLLDIE
jgi:hypothetical protein